MIYNHLCKYNTKEGHFLPEFLSLRFLNTDMITSRFPSTSTTVVKIKTLARIAMTQAGRALSSVSSARSSCPSRGSVRFFMSVNVSGITGPQPNAAFKSQLCFKSRRYRRYLCPLNKTWIAPGCLSKFQNARKVCYIKSRGVRLTMWFSFVTFI